jgi:hypothetical protein
VFWSSIQSEKSPSSSASVLVLLAMNSVMRTCAMAGSERKTIKNNAEMDFMRVQEISSQFIRRAIQKFFTESRLDFFLLALDKSADS